MTLSDKSGRGGYYISEVIFHFKSINKHEKIYFFNLLQFPIQDYWKNVKRDDFDYPSSFYG